MTDFKKQVKLKSEQISYDPAIVQLRELPNCDLDGVVTSWLKRSGFTNVRRVVSEMGPATYVAHVGKHPFALPILVSVYQRKNHLQIHHVDGFLGVLVRQGYSGGILVTTGSFSRSAVQLSVGLSPRIRLVCGQEWVPELARAKAGIGRTKLRCWILDLATLCKNGGSYRKGSHVSG